MGVRPVRILLVSLLVLTFVSCANKPSVDPRIEALVAQKLMLDIRYFCRENDINPATQRCTTPVTTLPDELKDMVADTGIGGIILFANNLQDTEQMIRLNRDLQAASAAGGHSPLLISIDQEGGRVVRIPQNISTAFSGNMAIGATYAEHGTHFATLSGDVIAKELAVLGFNVNFAPSVDVNVNPENPVINVRSFGEDPHVVSQLGFAQMQAMQNNKVIAALKHFPGHGDTSTDSHSGLPLVEHDLAKIKAVDLAPFQYAIDHGDPGMIMTAHIQYPALDNSMFTATNGTKTVLPATMSRAILTVLLRDKMGFNGVIITDALDMAAIAHFYEPTEAVLQTFKAGTDIALMPLAIRTAQDIPKLKKMITDLAYSVQTGELSLAEVEQSVARINALKQRYVPTQKEQLTLSQALVKARKTLASPAHLKAEQELANSAIVAIKNQQAWPIKPATKIIQLVMPDNSKCMAMTTALDDALKATPSTTDVAIRCASLVSDTTQQITAQQRTAQLVIFSDITPQQSLVEMGGMDDITDWRLRPKKEALDAKLMSLMKEVKPHQISLLISMRTPYAVVDYADYLDGILASFAYNTQVTEQVDASGQATLYYDGPIYRALANILVGNQRATGALPVSIDKVND
ncbi:MAG: glycoside hydrolase family 3 protein [Paraglaciecola chathamensis]